MAHLSTTHIQHAAPKTRGLFALISDTFELAKERAQLRALSADQLRDIGHSRAEADAEAARAPWDAPAHWKR